MSSLAPRIRTRVSVAVRVALAGLLLAVGWACGDTLVSVILVDRVDVSPVADSMFVDESVQLEARASDADGNTLYREGVTWSSGAGGIAEVDSDGLVRGLAPGVATITASIEGISGDAAITVLRWPELESEPTSVGLDIILGEDGDSAVAAVVVRNIGDGELAGLAATVEHEEGPGGWLEATFAEDSILVLTARAAGLEPGEHGAEVAVSSSTAINSPLTIDVRLEVVRRNPVPTLGALSPTTALRDSTLDVTLTGGAFLEGLTTVSFGPDVVVGAVDVTAPDRLVARITVGRDAATGPRDVAVTNPAPGGGTAVLAAAFLILEEHPFPTLQRAEPSSAHREATLDVTLEGTGFVAGVTTVDFGPAVDVDAVTVTGPTVLVATITIGAAAAAGPRDVRVANPEPGGGIATRPDAFTVLGTNPVPELTGLSPTESMRQRTLDVEITGANFSASYTTVDFGAGIVVDETTVTGTTSLRARITIQADAALGPRAVHVTNAAPGGGTATLDDAFNLLLGDVSATESSVSVAPDTVVADLVESATVTVVVRDENGDAIGDLADAFEIDAGSSVDVSSVAATPTRGTYMFSIKSSLAQAAMLLVAVNGVALAERPTVEFVAGKATETSTVSVSNATPLADGLAPATVTVTLADQFDNPITTLVDANFVIDLGETDAERTLVVNNGDGTYTFDVTNVTAEDVTVTVTAGGILLSQTPTITFVPGGAEGTQSSVSATPLTDVVAGVESSTVTVNVADANGNPIDGLVDADFTIDAGGATDGEITTTGMAGQYSFQVTSTAAGTFEVTVSIGAETLGSPVSITFVPGAVSGSVSDATADPTVNVPADGTTTSTVTILVRDSNNNPIPDLASGAFGVIAAPTGASISAVTQTATPGTYQFTVSNTEAETVTLAITVDGIALVDEPTVTFVADAVNATNSSATASPTDITAGETSTITVTLRDANQNLVSGQAAAFAIVFTTGTATFNNDVTETAPGSGVYEFTVSSETAGTVTVQITVDSVVLGATPTITVNAGAVSAANSTVTAPASMEVDPDSQ